MQRRENTQKKLSMFQEKSIKEDIIISTLNEKILIPYQTSQILADPDGVDGGNGLQTGILNVEIFNEQSLFAQSYSIEQLRRVETKKIKIEINTEPLNDSPLSQIAEIISGKKDITQVHVKFHYQMQSKEIKILDQIMDKKELTVLKITIENNQVVTDLFSLLKERLEESQSLESFSLEILNYSIKSKDTYLLSEGIRQNKSLKEIEIVSYFLIHEYQNLVQAIGQLQQIEVVKLDLTYSTDYVSDILVEIGEKIAKQLPHLRDIQVSFSHFRTIENEAIIKLLECIYSNSAILSINLSFPFTILDISEFTPFEDVRQRSSPLDLYISFKIASDQSLDYVLQIFRLNTFRSINIKSIKNMHLRSSKLLNQQIMLDHSLQKFDFQGSFNDFVLLEEGLKQSQISTLGLALKFDIIDFPKLKVIGNILFSISRLSHLSLVFNDCTYDVRHLNNLIVNKLESQPHLTYMKLTLFKYSSKQDQLIQFFEENINSRVILDITPHNYTMEDPNLHIINLMAREQMNVISKIFFYNTHIAPLLHYNPTFIFSDLFIE